MADRESRPAVDIAAFVAGLAGSWQNDGGYRARCPAHNDIAPSLSVNMGKEGRLIVHCHAGCDTADVLTAMGKTFADITPSTARRVVEQYPYHDHDDWSVVKYTAVRYEPKDFRILPPGLPPAAERVLYCPSAIKYSRETGTPIFVVEGEKDANALLYSSDPTPATTNVGGAGKWLPQYSEQLAGCHVKVVVDNDGPGYKHGIQVATALIGRVLSVEVLRAAPGCKDISDHLAAGHTLDELIPLEPVPTLTGVLVSEVQITSLDWAWAPYFPRGTLCLIDGDPGDGKSVLTIDLAARWSAGMAMPDGSANAFGGPVGVIMIGAEDDPATTIAPRLRAAGCRPTMVKLITGGASENVMFNLTTDLDGLEAEIVALDAKVVVIDPAPAFFDESTNTYVDASVRRALMPLAMLARRQNILILLVRHLNKGGSGKAIYRGGGSIGFIAAARAAYLVGHNPEDETQRVLAAVKNNLASNVPSLVYEVISDPTYGVARVQWHGALAANAQELLDGASPDSEGRADVQDFLRHICATESYKWADILKIGKEAGFSANALEKHRGHVLTKQFSGGIGNRGVLWGLRGGPKPQPAVPLRLESAARESQHEDATEPELDTDELKDAALAAAPLICDVCHDPDEHAMRFARPHWVVRCRAHNPITYHAQKETP
jgi:putative DNA primase/helicase